jgi:outer membrane protein OmpA-like peptidoglycan-associated protein
MRYKALDISDMKITISLFFSIGILNIGLAQEYKIKYAKQLSAQYKFVEALPVWEELATKTLKSNTPNWELLSKTVEAAYFSENYRKASTWGYKLVSKGKTMEQDWVYFLKATQYINQGSRTAGILDSALKVFPNSAWLNLRHSALNQMQTNLSKSSEYVIRMYKKDSKGEEYGAFPYKTGILFVSNEYNHSAVNRNYPRTGQFYSDIAFFDSTEATKNSTVFQKPFWIDLLYKNQWREIDRSKAHDGPISFSPDKNLVFVTTNFSEKDKSDTVKYKRLQQRVYSLINGIFTEIEFPFNSVNYSTGHASMDEDGNVYFVSDRPGSMVQSINNRDTVYSADIWKTTYSGGEWSDPVNLGPSVNTIEDELFPFISNWGVLYFSSFAWGSIGGLDIFSSELNGKKPEHIGTPLNSTSDDFAYYVDEETGKGYFSTNRDRLADRIYAFKKPVFRSDLVVSLADCKGKALKNTEITVTDLNNGESMVLETQNNGQTEPLALKRNHEYKIIYLGTEVLTGDSSAYKATQPISESVNFTSYYKRFISKVTVLDSVSKPMTNAILTVYRKNGKSFTVNTDSKGSYTWRNEGDAKVDSVVVTAINYQDGRLSIPATENGNCIDTVVYELPMRKLSDEQFVRLDMVLYNFDKYFLRPEGKLELDKLVAYMNAHPKYRVELSSHTDSRGSDKYNMKLSKNRAKSCVDYIISKGISKKMITAQGYGETRLVNNCANGVPCTKEQHQANRRTELKLFTPEEDALDNNKLKE